MGFLSKLTGKKSEPTTMTKDELTCLHVAMTPRWDSLADMGNEAKASRWTCDACGQDFTPEDAQQLRATEAARLKSTLNIQ